MPGMVIVTVVALIVSTISYSIGFLRIIFGNVA
jgi:hypothetical protein